MARMTYNRGKSNNKYRHGMWKTIFYRKWADLKTRCLNPKNKRYKDYGGRGINVCDRWLDFMNFKEDMYESYLEHVDIYGDNDTTIDRINNNGNYCKDNCKWSTNIEQHKNRRDFLKKIKATSPNNEIIISNNICEFSKKYNLDLSSIYKCLRGNINHCKNWKFEEIM